MSHDNRGAETPRRNVPGDTATVGDTSTRTDMNTDGNRSPRRNPSRADDESMNDREFNETITEIVEWLDDYNDAAYEALAPHQKANYQEALVFLSRLEASFEK